VLMMSLHAITPSHPVTSSLFQEIQDMANNLEFLRFQRFFAPPTDPF